MSLSRRSSQSSAFATRFDSAALSRENLAIHERSRAALHLNNLNHDRTARHILSVGNGSPPPPSPNSIRSNPMSLMLPAVPTEMETAFTAMQYLPIPVLVLNSLKTVVLANESFGRLVAESKKASTSDSRALSEAVTGQTLSQIGTYAMSRPQHKITG